LAGQRTQFPQSLLCCSSHVPIPTDQFPQRNTLMADHLSLEPMLLFMIHMIVCLS
jgi:hypothetical protein